MRSHYFEQILSFKYNRIDNINYAQFFLKEVDLILFLCIFTHNIIYESLLYNYLKF